MDQHLNAKRRGDVATTMHVKIESVDDDDASALDDLGSQESSAPCSDDTTGGALDPLSTEEQAAATNTHILLYPVSTDRFLLPSGDEKTFLKISPAASAVPAPPPEKWSAPNSDFSSKAVMCLIEAVGRRWGLYETRERSQLFQSVQEELAAKGHILPVEKIRRKWNNLIVTYKRVKDRSRETGHAKTSWEFFDLMNATLGDTVGAQIVNNKNRTSNTPITTALKKIAAKPHVSESTPYIRSYGDFGATCTMKSMALVNTNTQINNTSSNNNISTASITTVPMATPQTKVSDMKPLIILNSNIVTASAQPATLTPSTSLLSSPYPTETPSPFVSLGLTNSMDPLLKTHPYLRLKAPSLPPAVVHSRLGGPELEPNLQGLCSPFPACGIIPPCFTSSGVEGQQAAGEEQSSAYMLQEVLRRQEEQAYTEQGARRRADARERRRERREVRMADSLGRIATALELLSSKQDTVIALLQRLADKK